MFTKWITEKVFRPGANKERLGNEKNKLSEFTSPKPVKRINNQPGTTDMMNMMEDVVSNYHYYTLFCEYVDQSGMITTMKQGIISFICKLHEDILLIDNLLRLKTGLHRRLCYYWHTVRFSYRPAYQQCRTDSIYCIPLLFL